MRMAGAGKIKSLIAFAFLIGLVVLVVARFSKDFAYDVESNLKSNQYYYP